MKIFTNLTKKFRQPTNITYELVPKLPPAIINTKNDEIKEIKSQNFYNDNKSVDSIISNRNIILNVIGFTTIIGLVLSTQNPIIIKTFGYTVATGIILYVITLACLFSFFAGICYVICHLLDAIIFKRKK
jgi:hypothetical protein